LAKVLTNGTRAERGPGGKEGRGWKGGKVPQRAQLGVGNSKRRKKAPKRQGEQGSFVLEIIPPQRFGILKGIEAFWKFGRTPEKPRLTGKSGVVGGGKNFFLFP